MTDGAFILVRGSLSRVVLCAQDLLWLRNDRINKYAEIFRGILFV